VNGVLLKYSEPPEARKSTKQFRLYVFKGKEQVSLVPISDRTVYLIGKDDRVVDIRLDHPSISGQHAVLQYRQIIEQNEYGDDVKSIRLYILDLKSSNGTRVNKEPIPTSRYYELKTGDVIEFGFSSREYVLMDESIV
jgi:smad nuclear-interacting protein 1